MIAQRDDVYRAALLHGWSTPLRLVKGPERDALHHYFTLIHQRENFFGRTCYAYLALGLTASCPLPGFSVIQAPSCPASFLPIPDNPLWIENLQPPFTGLQLHVFSLKPGSFEGIGDFCHQSTSRNGWIARARRHRAVAHPGRRLELGFGDETYGDGIRSLADNCPAPPTPARPTPTMTASATPAIRRPRHGHADDRGP